VITSAVILTQIRRAVSIDLAVGPFESFWTGASITIDAVSTRAAILTWSWIAVVDVGLAIVSQITRGTGARVAVDAVQASTAIQAWVWRAVGVNFAIDSAETSKASAAVSIEPIDTRSTI
jgi:hypothetical protein